MDVASNKTRKDTRAVVSLVARYRSPSTFEFVEEACCDVSAGGMFIKSAAPTAPGTLLKLECETGIGASIRGVARVVWLRAEPNDYGPSGMGVKFVKLEPESRDVITRIVQELAAAGIESASMSSAPEDRGKPPTQRNKDDASAPEPKRTALALPSRAEPSIGRSSNPPQATNTKSNGPDQRSEPAAPAQQPEQPRAAEPSPSTQQAGETGAGALMAQSTQSALNVAAGAQLATSSMPAASPASSEGAIVPVKATGRAAPDAVGAMERPAPSSRPPGASEAMRGRAFWMVAAAVVVLGVTVAMFARRIAQEPQQPDERAANSPHDAAHDAASQARAAAPGASASASASASAMEQMMEQQHGEAPQSPASGVQEPASATATSESGERDREAIDETQQAPAAQPPVDEPGAATHAAVSDTKTTPAGPAQVGAAAPSEAAAKPHGEATSDAVEGASAEAPETEGPATPPPSAAEGAADEATQTGRTTSEAPAAPTAASASHDASEAEPKPPEALAQPAQPTAASASHDASKVEPKPPEPEAPPLAPGEVAHIVSFTSRPSGATILVGDQTIVTPAQLNLGGMSKSVRVIARKEGYESASVLLDGVTEFQRSGDVLRREVHMVLPKPAATSHPPPTSPSP